MRIRYLKKTEEVLENSPWVIDDPSPVAGRWRQLMKPGAEGAGRPKRCLEIGCGKGKFICQMAKAHPDTLFVGDERVSTILARTALKAMTESGDRGMEALPNLRLIRVSAEELEEVFAPGEIDRIYLTFSDPWPKDKHAKRRLTSDRFLPIYRKLLSPEGDLCFKTDNDALFEFSLESLPAAGFRILDMSHDLHGEDFDRLSQQDPGVLVTTEYEENFIRIQKNIHYLRAAALR